MVKLFMGSVETWMKENYWRPEERKSEFLWMYSHYRSNAEAAAQKYPGGGFEKSENQSWGS